MFFLSFFPFLISSLISFRAFLFLFFPSANCPFLLYFIQCSVITLPSTALQVPLPLPLLPPSPDEGRGEKVTQSQGESIRCTIISLMAEGERTVVTVSRDSLYRLLLVPSHVTPLFSSFGSPYHTLPCYTTLQYQFPLSHTRTVVTCYLLIPTCPSSLLSAILLPLPLRVFVLPFFFPYSDFCLFN